VAIYNIYIKEQLGEHWSSWFEGMTVTWQANGGTLLSGEIVDQAALHGVLNKLRDLQLTLLSVYAVPKNTSP
jgi:hypothetical protein